MHQYGPNFAAYRHPLVNRLTVLIYSLSLSLFWNNSHIIRFDSFALYSQTAVRLLQIFSLLPINLLFIRQKNSNNNKTNCWLPFLGERYKVSYKS